MDPNPYVAPIEASTVGELVAALNRFTVDDQALPVMLVCGDRAGWLARVEYDAIGRQATLHRIVS